MGHAREKLNALTVERLSKKPGLHNDGGGLCLRVTSPTARSWVLRYMLDGKSREMGMGAYPDTSLADARLIASEARKLKAQGKDPIAVRNSLRTEDRLEAARTVTFRHCAQAYIEAQRDGWKNPKNELEWQSTLKNHALPLIGDLPVQAVDVAMIHKVLAPIWSSKTVMANRLRGRIEAILDWAKVRGFRQGDNPARWKGHIQNLFPARSRVHTVKHHAALPYSDIGAFMATLKTEDTQAAQALQFTILTAARTAEAVGAKWDEMNLDAGIWTIPGTRMKGGREHRVPLSKYAIAILRVCQKSAESSPFVFPSSKPNKPIFKLAMLQALRKMGGNDLTVHGFRSTFRDWAAEQTAFAREVAEAALAHTIGDKVEAAYRRGDLFEKRRKLMDAWAAYCGTAKADGKVIPIRARK